MNVKSVRRQNLIAIIDALFKGNRAAFARAIDRPAPNVHRMLAEPSDEKDTRGIGEQLARDIESKLNLRRLYLDSVNVFVSEDGERIKAIGLGNTETGPDLRGEMIPLISWVQAGLFCTSPDLFQPGSSEEWVPSFKNVGTHGYALRVKGDSMVAPFPNQKSYPEGTIIYVNPEKPVTNGCKVIAKIEGTEEATFKIYSEDGGKRFLRPLNPQYPTIEMTEGMVICGVVIGGWIDD